jgi:ornithine cyclodeaminase/alanine dehydrogenase-like protein (mu-crystallin family)
MQETCLFLLFSHATAELLAILPDEHIQRLRVGATSALGAKYLARPGASVLGILGSRRQAETQLEAMALVCPLTRVLVYSPTADHRLAFAARMRERCELDVEAVTSPAEVLAHADIVTSAANAAEPTFDGAGLRPGIHVNTISIAQVDDAALGAASLFTASRGPNLEYLPRGREQRSAGQARWYARWDQIQELEQVMIGESPGRRGADEITLFFSNGAGLQLAALGREVLERARERGLGRHLAIG